MRPSVVAAFSKRDFALASFSASVVGIMVVVVVVEGVGSW